MESKPDLKLLGILDNIGHYFDFLFGRGFQMASMIFVDREYENWQVTLITNDCIIKIYHYGGKVDLALSTLQLYNTVGLFALDDLIYWVNGNRDLYDPLEEISKNENQCFERLAWRLEKHIDNILSRIKKVHDLPSMDDSLIISNNSGQMFHNN
jgi:hypothetical protein